MGRHFYGAGDILIRRRYISSVDYLTQSGFFMGETFECGTVRSSNVQRCSMLSKSVLSDTDNES